MKTAVCNRAAFEPFQRLVTGPFMPEDLPEAERFVRAVVLHDDLRMLPERFRINVDVDGYSTVSPLSVTTNEFEYFGDYFDPSFVETPEGRKLLENATRVDRSRRFFFDPYKVSVILAIEQVRIGGSAVVQDSTWEIEVVHAREQTREIKLHSANGRPVLLVPKNILNSFLTNSMNRGKGSLRNLRGVVSISGFLLC